MIRVFFTLLFLLSYSVLLAQNGQPAISLRATILDGTANQPLPYANVFNHRLQNGTATNQSGYFELPGNQIKDSITISYLGYISVTFLVERNMPTVIRLQPNTAVLGEVVVLADDSYLYDMIAAVRKNRQTNSKTAKTYFYLQTNLYDQPVEMIEAYYNGQYSNYGADALALKKGRIGLRPINQRYFSSTESSRLFSMQNLFNKSSLFPDNPLSLKKRAVRKHFALKLKGTYVEGGAKIYIIGFTPKQANGRFFSGTLWIDQTNSRTIKTNFQIKKAATYPFVPIGFNTFQTVNMDITRTYREVENELYVNTIDFNYDLTYLDRDSSIVRSSTQSFSKAYDYEAAFTLPFFTFTKDLHEDYRNITLIPYDAFFWKNTKEFRFYDRLQEVERFVKANYIEGNLLYPDRKEGSQQLESPYLPWSEGRILLQEAPLSKIEPPEYLRRPDSDRSHLNIKLFLDINYIGDSLTYQIAAVLDPIDSYYHFHLSDHDHAYINMYFDLMEIEKRALTESLQSMSNLNSAAVSALHAEHLRRFAEQGARLTKETNRGTNMQKMEAWNDLILRKLKIDNLDLFKLKEPDILAVEPASKN